MTSPTITIQEFTPVIRNSLRGFAKVALPSGMILSDVSVHVSGETAWASPASKPVLDRNGMATRDSTGKIRYVPVVSFARRDIRDRFSTGVIEALRASHPEALT